MKWADNVARMEKVGLLSKFLTRKPTGKMPLGRSRRRWEDYIRMYLTDSAQNRDYWRALVNASLNLRVP